MSKNYKKFIAVGDNHGDKCDPVAFEGMRQFIKEFKPDHRIHLGDCFDFRSLRRGVNAGDGEAGESLHDDIMCGLEFIDALRPTAFLYGNHEDRIHAYATGSSDGRLRDYAFDVDSDIKSHLRGVGCKTILPYHAENGVYRLGPIAFVHGYSCNRYAVEEHATHYGTSGGAVIMGHIHRIASSNARKHGGVVGFSGGCMCLKKEMEYAKNRMATSQWGLGWTYGVIEGNLWKVWQAHRFGDGWIWTTEVTTWKHKTK
jgi:hypothetical protein